MWIIICVQSLWMAPDLCIVLIIIIKCSHPGPRALWSKIIITIDIFNVFILAEACAPNTFAYSVQWIWIESFGSRIFAHSHLIATHPTHSLYIPLDSHFEIHRMSCTKKLTFFPIVKYSLQFYAKGEMEKAKICWEILHKFKFFLLIKKKKNWGEPRNWNWY